MSDSVIVGRYLSLAEASTPHGLLEAGGLSPQIRDEYTAGLVWYYIPAMGGVRLEVPAEQEDQAREILAAEAEPSAQSSEEDRDHLHRAGRRRRILGLVALFFTAPWLALLGLPVFVSGLLQRRDDNSTT